MVLQDYAAVNQIQSSMSASPLISAAAPPHAGSRRAPRGHDPYPQTGAGVGTAPIGSGLPMPAPMQLPPGTPSEQAAALDAASFFALFFDTLRNNPPHANDGPMLDRMRRIGLDDRRPFNFGRLSPEVQQALADAQPLAGRRIADGVTRLGTPLNGWNTVLSGIGTYGTDYTRRASIAYAGLGAPTPEDVLYPVTVADSRGARSIRTRTTCCTSRGPAAAGQRVLVAASQQPAWLRRQSRQPPLRSSTA